MQTLKEQAWRPHKTTSCDKQTAVNEVVHIHDGPCYSDLPQVAIRPPLSLNIWCSTAYVSPVTEKERKTAREEKETERKNTM